MFSHLAEPADLVFWVDDLVVLEMAFEHVYRVVFEVLYALWETLCGFLLCELRVFDLVADLVRVRVNIPTSL